MYSEKVFTWYVAASSRNRQAMAPHAVTIPATHPTAVHVSSRPVAYAAPGSPSSAHDDSPVARSESAAAHPGRFRPAIE